MSRSYPLAPLGEILRKSEEWIGIDPDTRYRQVTVRLWGKGVVLRGEIDGREIAAKKQLVVRSRQFILSRIDARHGAFGLVPDSLDGAVVSQDFPAFTLDRSRIIPKFLEWMSKSSGFANLCKAASEGTTNRVRLKEDRFLTTKIPLPPLEEQQQIVARIDALALKIDEARKLRDRATDELSSLFSEVAWELMASKGDTAVGDFATIQSGYAFKSEWFTERGIRLVRNINIGHGRIEWTQVARIHQSRGSEFNRFDLREGDMLISLDRPIISTGVKVARVTKTDIPCLLLQRVGRVCFLNDSVVPEFFFSWLQSPAFMYAIDPGRSNAIPHISPKDIERIQFAPPPLPEQRRIVEYLNDLQAKVDILKRLQSQTSAELDRLLPSVLDRALNGEL